MKKNVFIYVIGSYKYDKMCGFYKVVLVYKNKFKIIQKEYNDEIIDNKKITSNRIMLYGIIDSIELLKEPCNIEVFTLTPLGFKKSKKSINFDLINRILQIIEDNDHDFKEVSGNAEKIKSFINNIDNKKLYV